MATLLRLFGPESMRDICWCHGTDTETKEAPMNVFTSFDQMA